VDSAKARNFEYFTGHARTVFALTNQEANRWHHEYIGTEHLLLGLVLDGECAAASVLRDFQIDSTKVRQSAEVLMKIGSLPTSAATRPQTPRVKRIIGYALEEARSRGDNYIGTGHILLGMLRDQYTVGLQILLILLNLKSDPEALREAVVKKLTDPTPET
jgi:ATP-dependent Clp protease ATP-binding subunit ClpC